MIPDHGWKPMESAPRDGTVFIVKHRQYDAKNGKIMIQPCQWLCDTDGTCWTWRGPWRMGSIAYADGWMTVQELQAAQQETKEDFDL